MPRESKVELYVAIRRDSRAGLSIREIARKHRVGNHTIAAALKSAWPAPRKPYPKRSSKLDPFKPVIDVMLRSDLDAPKKQRHTVTRIYARLIEEHAMSGIAYQTVREYVAERKPQIWVEAGRGPAKVFIPQTHRPGEDAEVDFGEVAIRLRGEPVTINLFALRMSFSGKGVHRAFASGGFEAFFEGHVHAFTVLGGVPRGKVRYDNLKAAVSRVLGFARYRQEADRWTAFRSHYDLEPFYCQPGIEGAHEKGGVEGDVGWFRRNHMVPVPEVDSLDELNLLIDEWDLADDNRRIGSRPHTVGEHYAVEKPLLKPLPEDRFETGRWFHPRVDRYSQVTVASNRYSVPVRLIGRQAHALLHANWIEIYDGATLAARHERFMGKGGSQLDLDHYLEGLLRKPGALAGATALDQARSAGKFTAVHDAWWAAARKAHGDRDGTRALIEVLLLHRHMPHEHVVAGVAAALESGALTADAVALEARRIADGRPKPVIDLSEPAIDRPIVSLTERRLAQLPPDNRPLPSVAAYDQLLRLRPAAQEGSATP
jgi:transposase